MAKLYQDQLRLQKRRRRRHRFELWAAGVFLLLAGLAYLSWFARLFDVRAVAVSGSPALAADITTAADRWLDSGRWGLRRRSNALLVNPADLSAFLLTQFPKLSAAPVTRSDRHTLAVAVSERQPAGVWCLTKTDVCYYFDQIGIAYQQTGPTEGHIFITVADKRDRVITLGAPVAEQSWLDGLALAQTQLARYNFAVAKLSIPPDAWDELDVETPAGWRILFSTGTNITQQAAALAQHYQTLTAEQRANLQYFDLRIQDRIYWK